ncbi:hypothetical protein [Streptomyces sp. t39]|uniref:hypothetical protein n=1 Tax=Streptomyces sp. t39 TaxID=1828156 RepID=UPI0011CD671B|nr:hypothetical protein [Streptomyces sp. t39]TXS35183.1 hypothetical protein EAO77_37545 [Streptomyces sp. t39]
MDDEWEAGAAPWLRRQQPKTTYANEPNPVQCMFCGSHTVKRSASDRDADPGRLELYCDNQLCDAREMVLLVKRDGAEAIFRADVRALHLIDNGTMDVHAVFPPEVKSYTMSDLLADHGNEVERRMRKAPPVVD